MREELWRNSEPEASDGIAWDGVRVCVSTPLGGAGMHQVLRFVHHSNAHRGMGISTDLSGFLRHLIAKACATKCGRLGSGVPCAYVVFVDDVVLDLRSDGAEGS